MPRFESVLVAIDFSEGSRAALDYGVLLARRFGAKLAALHVTPRIVSYEPLPTFPEPAPLDPERLQDVVEGLRRFATPPGSEHPLADAVVREGDPADEILAQAAASGADLVVLGTHGRRGFERWILGSVTERVARKTDRAVLAVHRPPGAASLARVLCALDLSDSSATTLAFAAAVAHAMGAELVVLYVASDVRWYEPWPVAGVDAEAVHRAVAESARERLSRLAARDVPAGVGVDLRVAFGSAQREIERMAGEGMDLVVLGASASSGVDRFFFGSTAQHVLRAGVCPVLLVRHPAGKE